MLKIEKITCKISLGMVLLLIPTLHPTVLADEDENGKRLSINETPKRIEIGNKYYQITFSKKHMRFTKLSFPDGNEELSSPYLATNFLQFDRSKVDHLIKKGVKFKTETDKNASSFKMSFSGQLLSKTYKVDYKITFTFYADKPIVKYDAFITQTPTVKWMLIRLNQWMPQNFISKDGYQTKKNVFTKWAVGEPRRHGEISDAKGSHKPTAWRKGYRWACLYNPNGNAFGLITFKEDSPFIYFYDGDKGNIYINGSYGEWNQNEKMVDQYIYFGPAGKNGENVEIWAKKLFNE